MDPQNRPSPQHPQEHPQAPAELPSLPSLEHLKKQAKGLRAACQQGEIGALTRLQRWFPDQTTPYTLSQAQLAIAREHGSASWAHFRRSVLNALVERLAVRHWSEWRVAAAARESLVQTGEHGLQAVLRGLSHPEPRVRRGAADFMDHHADDRCVPHLAKLVLHDPVPYVRWTALHALKCQRCKPAPLSIDLTSLLARVAQEDPSPRVRWRAVESLPTEQLARVAQDDSSPRVTLRALAALGSRRNSILATQTLENALHDPCPDVRSAAHQALRRQSPEYRQLVAQRAREANQARLGAAGATLQQHSSSRAAPRRPWP